MNPLDVAQESEIGLLDSLVAAENHATTLLAQIEAAKGHLEAELRDPENIRPLDGPDAPFHASYRRRLLDIMATDHIAFVRLRTIQDTLWDAHSRARDLTCAFSGLYENTFPTPEPEDHDPVADERAQYHAHNDSDTAVEDTIGVSLSPSHEASDQDDSIKHESEDHDSDWDKLDTANDLPDNHSDIVMEDAIYESSDEDFSIMSESESEGEDIKHKSEEYDLGKRIRRANNKALVYNMFRRRPNSRAPIKPFVATMTGEIIPELQNVTPDDILHRLTGAQLENILRALRQDVPDDIDLRRAYVLDYCGLVAYFENLDPPLVTADYFDVDDD